MYKAVAHDRSTLPCKTWVLDLSNPALPLIDASPPARVAAYILRWTPMPIFPYLMQWKSEYVSP